MKWSHNEMVARRNILEMKWCQNETFVHTNGHTVKLSHDEIPTHLCLDGRAIKWFYDKIPTHILGWSHYEME